MSLRRFLHLERPRAEGPDATDASPATAERFGGVERPGKGPAAPQSSGADLDRFGPEPPPRIELLETTTGEQPFTRCMLCNGMLAPIDSQTARGVVPPDVLDRFATLTRCQACGRIYWPGSHYARMMHLVEETLAATQTAD